MQLTYGLLQNINSFATFNKVLSGATVTYVMISAGADADADASKGAYDTNVAK